MPTKKGYGRDCADLKNRQARIRMAVRVLVEEGIVSQDTGALFLPPRPRPDDCAAALVSKISRRAKTSLNGHGFSTKSPVTMTAFGRYVCNVCLT